MAKKARARVFLNAAKWASEIRLPTTLTGKEKRHKPSTLTRAPTRPPSTNILAFLLCYALGYYGVSAAWLLLLFLVLLIYWSTRHREVCSVERCRAELNAQRERVLGDREKGEEVEWVNFALDRWWKCSAPTVNRFVKDWIEPIIDSFKLPVGVESIEVVTFDIGPYRPILSNLRLLEQTMTGSDSFQPLPPSRLATPTETEQRSREVTVVFEVDLDIDVPQANFLLRTRLGGGRMGQNFILNIDSFRLKGCLRCFVSASNSAPFPHLTTAKIAFVEKPLVEATCKILKESIEIFDIPVLREMVMKYVLAGFKSRLVYPEGIDIDFSLPSLPTTDREKMKDKGLAEGVLTVTLTGSKPESGKGEGKSTDIHEEEGREERGRGREERGREERGREDGGRECHCSLQLGIQHCRRRFGGRHDGWSSSFSFLVHSLETQDLEVKMKRKRGTMQSSQQTNHSVSLGGLGLDEATEDDPVIRQVTVSAGSTRLRLSLHYTPLDVFSLTRPHPLISHPNYEGADSGVLYIQIHGAVNLTPPSSSSSSCVLSCSAISQSHTLFTTSATPTSCERVIWEEGTELLVPGVADMKIRFEVQSSSNKPGSHDLLGYAHYNLNSGPTHLVQHRLPLTLPNSSTSSTSSSSSSSSLHISLIFRSVASVQLTRDQLISDFVSRTGQTSLASCLDQTTHLLNPHPHGPSNHIPV